MSPQPPTPHTAPTRAEINKQNAQHSTGPRTAEGKLRVSANATKHGLTAKSVILAEAESERYENLLSQLTRRWRPETEEEHGLVCSLRDAQWRLHSIPVMQINLTTLVTAEHMEAYEHLENPAAQRCAAQASAYRANAKLFDQFSRHEGRLERTIRDIEQRLTALRAERHEQAQRALLERQNEALRTAATLNNASRHDPTKQTQPVAGISLRQAESGSPSHRNQPAPASRG